MYIRRDGERKVRLARRPVSLWKHDAISFRCGCFEIEQTRWIYMSFYSLRFPHHLFSFFSLFSVLSLSRPLVAGTSESDQLDRIFRLLGTPSPQLYPDIVNLPEYSPDLPQYPPPRGGVASLVPTLDPQGLNLLEQMLQYDPSRRISAQGALEHPFFSDLNVGNSSTGVGSTSGGGAVANVSSGGR